MWGPYTAERKKLKDFRIRNPGPSDHEKSRFSEGRRGWGKDGGERGKKYGKGGWEG